MESLETRLALASLMQMTASTTNLSGAPVSSVMAGDEFMLKVSVKDLRATPKGPFAAWVDVEYDPAAAGIRGAIQYGPQSINQQTGDLQTPGLMDEVGAFSGIAASAPTEIVLFQIRLKALAVGTTSFSLNPADLLPIHDSLLYGRDTGVAVTDINYVGTSLNVIAAPPSFAISPIDTPEGQVASLSGSFLNSITSATQTLTVNWGDWNDSGASTFSLPATSSLTAGQQISSQTDAGTLTIDSVDTSAGSVTFHATHQYKNDGLASTDTMPVNVANITATLDSAAFGSATPLNRSTTATVRNQAPQISQVTNSGASLGQVSAGQSVAITATVTDAGPLDRLTAQIAWGDGSTSSVPITGANSQGALNASHVYLGGGVFPVTITVSDQDKGVTTSQQEVIVTGAGLVGRTLFAVGTTGNDSISIIKQNTKNMAVTANFLAAPGATSGMRIFPLTGVSAITVIAGAGDDTVTINSSVTVPAVVIGGAGNDVLQAGGGATVLVGGDGNDQLIGGSKRTILIGGIGSDVLTSQKVDDILIGGSTQHDNNATALMALLNEWQRTDLNAAKRIANLRTGGGRNGSYALNSSTVTHDADADTLSASSGTNWFWANESQDTIVKKLKTDLVN